MGPRSHERGNYRLERANVERRGTLQWGRVLMNAETSGTEPRPDDAPLLQWGRVLMNAETWTWNGGCVRLRGCFNGAAFS